jgi:class 3 adenylate cyclase
VEPDRIERRVADLLADAVDAAAAGHWPVVRSLCDAVLALRPAHPGVRELLAQADEADAALGERRQLTVMFCDVVGSTRLTQTADPEIVRTVLRNYRRVVDDAVTRNDGYIAVWQGDGAVVYFGHPRPHEDDGWRAVRTGLEIVEGVVAVADAARRDHDIEFAIRIAIHTGLVIRAEMGTSSLPDHDAIVGDTPAISARLQEKARPGTVLISEHTHELVRGRFSVVPVGPFWLRGVADPVVAYEVQSEAPTRPGAEMLADRGTTMVGRTTELATVRTMWDEVRAGGYASAFVRGDPGIGKTRLAAELRRYVLDDGGRALVSACSSYQASTPLHPVRRLVESAAGIGPSTGTDDARERLADSMSAVGRADAFPIIADLLGFEAVPGTGPPELDPLRLREVTLTILAEWLTAEAARSPILVVLDDVQWADPTTLELLVRIVSTRPTGVLLVLLARSGMQSLWSATTVPLVELSPLDAGSAEALVAELSGGAMDPALMAKVVDRSDGVPLYAEELVRAALGAAPASGPLVAAPPYAGTGPGVPASLRDPLLTRLAATGPDLGLAQVIATIGDDVALDLLSAVTDIPPEAVAEGTARLVESGVLEPVTGSPTTYRFHHQLLADLAYETQLQPIRRQRHAQVATVLRGSPDLSAVTSGTALAHHLEYAGLTGEAIEEYLVVIRDIQRRGSHTEAIQLLDNCIALLPNVDTDERDGLELRVLSTRGFSVTATMGYGSPQADADYRRTAELLRQVRPGREHALALLGAFSYFLIHGDVGFAEELNEDYRRNLTAHGLVDSAMPVDAGRCLTAFFRGDFPASVQHGSTYLAGLADPIREPVPEGYPLPNELVTTIAGTVGLTKLFMLDLVGADEAARQVEARIESLPFPFGAYSRA